MANIYRNFYRRGIGEIREEGFVIHQTDSGKNLLINKPLFDDNLTYTETQDVHQAMLREAGTYASFAGTNEAYLRKARETGATSYYMALADWFGAPRVLEINVDDWTGKPGETICVKARDNMIVAKVDVVIRDAQGNVLEIGKAVPVETGSPWWRYTTQSHVLMMPFPGVQAIAWDLAGNRASIEIA